MLKVSYDNILDRLHLRRDGLHREQLYYQVTLHLRGEQVAILRGHRPVQSRCGSEEYPGDYLDKQQSYNEDREIHPCGCAAAL